LNLKNDIKFKYMTPEEIIISVDRLTRFKDPAEKYIRVFKDIISGHLLLPSIKKNQIETLNPANLKEYVEIIINKSLENFGFELNNNFVINQKIYEYENSIFEISDEINCLIDNKINYFAIIELLKEDLPFNLKWLKTLQSDKSGVELREKYVLIYPVEKVVLTEGITEEILLPKFAKILDCDFGKKGIYVISAGGKNQVVKYFYKYSQILKIPIFVLLDNDAQFNQNQITPKLRANDYVHILDSGEFEDLFPEKLIKKALNHQLANISIIDSDILNQNIPMTKRLEEIFRTRGLHEFKKSEFAQSVKQLSLTKEDLSDEIHQVIAEIVQKKSLSC